MLKHVPPLCSVKMKENLALIDDFLATPAPRTVPASLARSCMSLFQVIGGILVLFGILLSWIFAFFCFTWPHGLRPLVPQIILFGIIGLTGFALYLIGFRIGAAKLRALKSGELCEATIDDISSVNMRINGQHYYKLTFSMADSSGEVIIGTEYIPDRAVPFFEQLQSERKRNQLDVLHVPGSGKNTYVPLKYVLTANRA